MHKYRTCESFQNKFGYQTWTILFHPHAKIIHNAIHKLLFQRFRNVLETLTNWFFPIVKLHLITFK